MIATSIKQWGNRSATPSPTRGVRGMTVSKSSSAAEYANVIGWAYKAFPAEVFNVLPLWEQVAGWRGNLIATCDYKASYNIQTTKLERGIPYLVAFDECPAAGGIRSLPWQCRNVATAERFCQNPLRLSQKHIFLQILI